MAETELARRLHEELGDRTGECVHCGFCLPACPTYVELGLEMDSPRGRISLVRALAEERIAPTPTVQRHLDLCLACRACETACPSGVRYGEIIEGARAILAPARGDARLGRALRRFALRHLLPHRRRLAVALLPLRLYRALGLQALARRLGLGRLLPRRLRWLASLAPRVEGPSFLAGSPAVVAAEGKRRMRVALFAGCVMDAAMASVHRATVRVLARNGCEVVLPRAQVCCGALHAHDGDREAARALGRRNVDALAQPGLDAVVLNAAGCGVQIREYGTLLAGEPAYAERARWLAESAIDLTVLLDRLGPRTPARRVERRRRAAGRGARPGTILATCCTGRRSPSSRFDCCGRSPDSRWSRWPRRTAAAAARGSTT